jgi:hypothetical protein
LAKILTMRGDHDKPAQGKKILHGKRAGRHPAAEHRLLRICRKDMGKPRQVREHDHAGGEEPPHLQ